MKTKSYFNILVCGLISILFLVGIAFAQPAVELIRSYHGIGDEELYDVYASDDGGYIMCGTTFNTEIDTMRPDYGDCFIVKVAGDGEREWIRIINNDPNEYSYSVIETDDGNYLIGGTQNDRFQAMMIDDEGDMIWNRTYADGASRAVIELKDGNFMLAGRSSGSGYLVMINEDGNVIWNNRYNPNGSGRFFTMRETDGGIVVGGWGRRQLSKQWIVKVELEEGELVWSRFYENINGYALYSIVSTRGGFVVSGWLRSHMYLMKINHGGERVWLREFAHQNYNEEAYCVDRLSDGGFVFVGRSFSQQRRRFQPKAIRSTDEGVLRWQEIYDLAADERFTTGVNWFRAVICGHDSSIIAVGKVLSDDETGYDGLLMKLEPEFNGALVIYHNPEDTLLSVLSGDSIRFIVRAHEEIEDIVEYYWIVDEDTISTDTTIVQEFDELGEQIISCHVFDGEITAAVNWHVNVTEFYINSHQPDSLNPSIRRNNSINFSVTTRAIEDDPVEYRWLLDDEQIAENDSVSIRFERGREHSVTAIASQGELADSVMWQVMINDLIVGYMPEQLELSVEVDTTFEFEVFPFDPNDDSLQFLWTLNGDSISDNSWVLVNFDSEGLYNITAYVSDTTESDSLTWEINVTPNSIYSDEPRHPDTPTLYPPMPNPFNSTTTVRYYLPTASQVRLSLFDVNGRLVESLVGGYRTRGQHSVSVDGSDLVSGVYFVRMAMERNIAVEKILLIR